ncbi:MAG: (Fe-S)-binding protein, partial [Bdellovibrionota bacterium]
MSYIPNIIYALLVIATFAFFGKNLLKIWKRFEYGKGKEENRLTNIPKRVYDILIGGLIQPKMFRDPIAGIMHAFIFWGFIIVSLGTLELILSGIFPAFDYGAIVGHGSTAHKAILLSQDFGNFIVFAAIVYAIVRRLAFPPKRFQGLEKSSRVDAMYVLTFILALVGTSLILVGGRAQAGLIPADAVPVGNAFASIFAGIVGDNWNVFDTGMFWIHSFILFGFVTFLPYSKHQHLIWVWPNIFFHNDKKRGRLRPMIFDENAESFGVSKPADFTWKQLLDSYTCVECGRCTEVCPANQTGKPLDPRKIMHDIKYSLINHATTPEAEHR